MISTNVGGISTLIEDGVDGFLIPSNEPHLLASKILELSCDLNKLTTISTNSIAVSHKRHNKIKIKENLLSLYKTIIDKGIDCK